jgi:sulfite exporter TauE/SafE
MSLTFLAGIFGASLVGSLHCAGMCGGIACFVGGTASGRRALLLYHAGRLASYTALGALAGAAGAALDLGGEAAGLGRAGTIIAGALVIATGAWMLARALGVRLPAPAAKSKLGRVYASATRVFAAADPDMRGLALGLLTALLPCGFLYLFLAAAAASGGALAGAATMAAFWAGTVPALLAVGFLSQRITPVIRRRAPAVAAVMLLAVALTALMPRLSTPAFASAPSTGEPACCQE